MNASLARCHTIPAGFDTGPVGSPLHEPVVRELPLTIEERALPPHPSPLPWGEGDSVPDLELANRFWLVHRRAVQFPLPEGEGQGEGEQDVSNPDAPNNTSVQGFKARTIIPGNSHPGPLSWGEGDSVPDLEL